MSVKDFVNRWQKVTGERADYQKFWLTLIRDVFHIDKPENYIQFEVPVQLAHKSFIDGYFPDSKVIIEQKAFGVDLEKEITQSDGSKLTPYEQARRYVIGLPVSMHPKKSSRAISANSSSTTWKHWSRPLKSCWKSCRVNFICSTSSSTRRRTKSVWNSN